MTTKTKAKKPAKRTARLLPPKSALPASTGKPSKQKQPTKAYKPHVGESVEFKFNEGIPRPEGDATVLFIEPLAKSGWMAKLDVTSVLCGDPDAIRNPDKELWAQDGELFKVGTRAKAANGSSPLAPENWTDAKEQGFGLQITNSDAATGKAEDIIAASDLPQVAEAESQTQPAAETSEISGDDMTKTATKTGKAKTAKKAGGKHKANGKPAAAKESKRPKVFGIYNAGPFARWLGRKGVDFEHARKIMDKEGGKHLSDVSLKWELREKREGRDPAKVSKEHAEELRNKYEDAFAK